jgi:hypothetical protein
MKADVERAAAPEYVVSNMAGLPENDDIQDMRLFHDTDKRLIL